MEKNETSFLIQCDQQANILKTFWYQPVFLISPYQKTLADLFTVSDRKRIDQMVKMVFFHEDVFMCEGSFRTASPEADVSLCMIAAGEKFLVLGFDAQLFESHSSAAAIKDMIRSLMGIIRSSDPDIFTENELMVREQFEMVQKLNNELINTQRQLKKANLKLNQLNSDLNNRLVKDSLTGLVSRYQYRQEIEYVISQDPEKLGIFTFIDLDGFKEINDTYGHRAGDQFLKGFADRLRSLPYRNMVCMRIAGDEFGLYIHGYEAVDPQDVRAIWNNIAEKVIKDPIQVGTVKEEVFCSAGMAVYGKDTADIYELIEYADFAMYEAKQSGKNAFRQFDLGRYQVKKASLI